MLKKKPGLKEKIYGSAVKEEVKPKEAKVVSKKK